MAAPATRPAWRRGVLPLLGGCALLAICLAALAVGGWLLSRRQPAGASQPAVEYVVDASPRMGLPAAGGEGTRLTVARSVLAEIIRPADPSVAAGLRVFGAGELAEACQDTRLVVPLAPDSQDQIAGELSALEAGQGEDAALAQAMLAAIGDLAATPGRRTLVVVTGGADSCLPEAGQAVADEAKRVGVDLRLFVIGYQVTPQEAQALRSLAAAGGGSYLEAANEAELRELLKAIQAHIENPETHTPDDVLATATSLAARETTPTPALSTATSAGPTEAATEPNGSDYESQTACDHPFFPLRVGAAWTYSSNTGTQTFQVTDVVGDATTATATLLRDGADTITWHCTGEGLAAYASLDMFLGVDPESVGWSLASTTGVWLPPAGDLVPGAEWDFHFVLEEDPAGGNVVIGSSDFAQDLAAVGMEAFELEGETVQALRIDSTLVTTPKGFPPAPGRDTYWLVQGVGLVRAEQWREFTTGPETVVRTLQSYAMP
jgi:hypothetical protein